jgi:hypothetical protein
VQPGHIALPSAAAAAPALGPQQQQQQQQQLASLSRQSLKRPARAEPSELLMAELERFSQQLDVPPQQARPAPGQQLAKAEHRRQEPALRQGREVRMRPGPPHVPRPYHEAPRAAASARGPEGTCRPGTREPTTCCCWLQARRRRLLAALPDASLAAEQQRQLRALADVLVATSQEERRVAARLQQLQQERACVLGNLRLRQAQCEAAAAAGAREDARRLEERRGCALPGWG